MRKFKFVGNKVDAMGYGKVQPVIGLVYNEDKMFSNKSVLGWANDRYYNISEEWQEVFEPTLQDKIQELKAFAKAQGLNVDVVVDTYRRTPKEHYEYIIKLFDEKIAEMEKVDIWDGVEFAECVLNSESYTVGKIYKIDPKFLPSIKTYQDDFGRENGQGLIYFKPSTESAYVEQLKKEAFERFGEIKEGDRFDTGYGAHSILKNHPEWHYNKHIDFFYYKGLIVYAKGQWASRIPKRIKVEWARTSCDSITFNYRNAEDVDLVRDGSKLAKQIEAYLNGDADV